MPLGTEISLGPGYLVLDGDPAPPTERGHSSFMRFRHISTSGLDVGASRASFPTFLQSLAPDFTYLDH